MKRWTYRTRGREITLKEVFVEGDDLSDPIADAVRAILDGHVVLDRAIAEGGRFPAVDVVAPQLEKVIVCDHEV